MRSVRLMIHTEFNDDAHANYDHDDHVHDVRDLHSSSALFFN